MAGFVGQRSGEVSWMTTTTAAALSFVLLITAALPSASVNELKGMKLALTEGSELFDLWKSASSSSLLKIYFFNITNPREVLMGVKPRVTEVGPYAYRVYRQKENITFLEEGAKVAAVTRETFVFVSEESVGDPNFDIITTVNIPLVAVLSQLHSYSLILRKIVSIWIQKDQLDILTSQTISKLLWGYTDPLLQKLHILKRENNEDFGLLLDRNGSTSGEYVFLTGESDYRDYAGIDTWNGQREVSCRLSNHSNPIRGTDGRVFHPHLTKEERLGLFVPAMKRSIYLEFEGEKDVRGIPAYRFTLPQSVLDSAEVNPNNASFCVPPGCLGSGLLSLTMCDGSPYVVSLPHFLLADHNHSAAIDGLLPRKDLHQMYVEVNPATGVVLRARRTLQWNIILQRILGFPITRHLKMTVIPIMYHKEVEEIDDVTETKLKRLLQTTQ